MTTFWRRATSLCVAGSFAGMLLMSGCAVRMYDPQYHDYHRWNRTENDYYIRWENENHMQHRNFRDRGQQQQDQYWQWRHQHENGHGRGHGHGNDHGRGNGH